jgi:hypothetical protein
MNYPKLNLNLTLTEITGVSFHEDDSYEDICSILTAYITELINNDFSQLISLLYRIDVPEKKLRQVLDATNGKDAASVIATMIIERQLEKIRSRERFKSNGGGISEEEKW